MIPFDPYVFKLGWLKPPTTVAVASVFSGNRSWATAVSSSCWQRWVSRWPWPEWMELLGDFVHPWPYPPKKRGLFWGGFPIGVQIFRAYFLGISHFYPFLGTLVTGTSNNHPTIRWVLCFFVSMCFFLAQQMLCVSSQKTPINKSCW